MEILNNKSFIQKIIVAIVIVLSFNFVAPTFSRAENDTIAETGGVLLGPVIDLIAGILDSVIVILQVCMDGTEVQFNPEGLSPFANGLWMVNSDDFISNGAGSYGMSAGASRKTVSIRENDLDHGWLGLGTYTIPVIKYSPEKIFANEVPGLEANFINPKFADNDKSIASRLQTTISEWYNTLRNLVLVLLLSVLLYVGIRMMLTSISSDKAKYKQMLMDWIVAVCLLFFLHYIMSFTMTFVDIIAEGIGPEVSDVTINISGGPSFNTNLTGYCRMLIQYKDLGTRLIYLLFYLGLTVLTVVFTWKYMKRAITMAFLTLMAPLVTLTYPIDKMGDGKAQAFNMWLREYIFNALLQPLHLILYSIFLGSSIDIAVENPLYAILILAFISPAEKILRKFFKFNQSDTASASFAGGFGGAAAFNMVKNLVNKGAKGLTSGKNGGGSGKNDNIRQQQQLTDPNAPDGVEAFALNGENDEKPMSEGERINRELENIRNMRNDPEYDTEEGRRYLDEEERRIRESDQRGVGEAIRDWTKEKWNNSRHAQEWKDNTEYLRDIRRATGQGIKNMAMKIPILGSALGNKHVRNTIKGFTGVVKGATPGAIRFTRKVASAAVMGAVGVGFGIAGDDLDDVWQMGAAGATLGYTAGPAVVDNIASGISSVGSATRRNYEAGVYGEEEAALREQDRQYVANEDNREYFEKQMIKETGQKPTKAQLNEKMKVAAQYNRAGITNPKQINKGMILEKELEDELKKTTSMSERDIKRSARDQAITIAKIANSMDAKDLRDPKKVKQLQDSFARELMSKDKNMKTNVAEAQASRILDMVKKQKKVY